MKAPFREAHSPHPEISQHTPGLCLTRSRHSVSVCWINNCPRVRAHCSWPDSDRISCLFPVSSWTPGLYPCWAPWTLHLLPAWASLPTGAKPCLHRAWHPSWTRLCPKGFCPLQHQLEAQLWFGLTAGPPCSPAPRPLLMATDQRWHTRFWFLCLNVWPQTNDSVFGRWFPNWKFVFKAVSWLWSETRKQRFFVFLSVELNL